MEQKEEYMTAIGLKLADDQEEANNNIVDPKTFRKRKETAMIIDNISVCCCDTQLSKCRTAKNLPRIKIPRKKKNRSHRWTKKNLRSSSLLPNFKLSNSSLMKKLKPCSVVIKKLSKLDVLLFKERDRNEEEEQEENNNTLKMKPFSIILSRVPSPEINTEDRNQSSNAEDLQIESSGNSDSPFDQIKECKVVVKNYMPKCSVNVKNFLKNFSVVVQRLKKDDIIKAVNGKRMSQETRKSFRNPNLLQQAENAIENCDAKSDTQSILEFESKESSDCSHCSQSKLNHDKVTRSSLPLSSGIEGGVALEIRSSKINNKKQC